MTALMVAGGGAIGVLARYGAGHLTFGGGNLIWVTLAINVIGSLLLGLLVATHWFSPTMREVLGVGVLGGFTTYSTFSVQIVLEADGGRPGKALVYLALSILLGVGAAAAGYALGKSFA